MSIACRSERADAARIRANAAVELDEVMNMLKHFCKKGN
jgi:hypothetical protein